MNNLIIKLKGGTGNQLFQAAAAASLSKIYNKKCLFDIESIGANKYKRKLEIEPILDLLSIKKNYPDKRIFLDEYDIDHPIYYTKNSPLTRIKIDFHLEGYFTNYRIHNRDIIENIRIYINQLDTIKKFDNENFFVLHIRELHGTGLNKSDYSIDSLDFDYYVNVFDLISRNSKLNKVKNAIVFSDLWENPENSVLLPKIKNLLKKYNLNYINGDKYIKTPLEILNIFSHSEFSIISNSTLSWWGGYLSKGKVFSPVMCLWEPNLKIPDNWNQVYGNEIHPRTHHSNLAFENFFNPKNLNHRILYNSKRKKIIALTRIIYIFISKKPLFSKIRNFLKNIGFLPENANSTFF